MSSSSDFSSASSAFHYRRQLSFVLTTNRSDAPRGRNFLTGGTGEPFVKLSCRLEGKQLEITHIRGSTHPDEVAVLGVSRVVDEALTDSLGAVGRKRLGDPLLEDLGDVGLGEKHCKLLTASEGGRRTIGCPCCKRVRMSTSLSARILSSACRSISARKSSSSCDMISCNRCM